MRPSVSRSQKHSLASDGSLRSAGVLGKGLSRSGLGRILAGLAGSKDSTNVKRGRLLLETLESRQLMAGDVEMLFTGSDAAESQAAVLSESGSSTSGLVGQPEGEPEQDLVAFAKALNAAGVTFFGAAWCPFCTEQKQLFQDGSRFLSFVEVTGPDRQLNATGISEGIATFPTWEFGDGSRLTGVQSLATLSQRSGVAIPTGETPSFAPIGPQTVLTGSPLHIPVDAYDPNGGPLTVTVSVDNPSLLDAVVLTGNRSIRIDMNGYDDMVFELFEDRAPVPTGRVIDLANSNFYDGIIFHRVVDGFVIQAGDPTGTGTSGSSLGNFDDQFNADLQHNRKGILSFAKTTDDTNNSQFFITETPTRHLDFNHSIFGQLVEGDDVREAISGTAVDASSKPTTNVTITSIEVFNDIENSVVMLKAKSNATGTTNVRFTVTDAEGRTFTEIVPVTVAADTANSQPFLNPITTPATTAINTAAALQLSSVDVEGDAVTYFASLATGSTGATASVNASTGLVTVTPNNNFVGTVNVVVGVRPGTGVTGNAASDNDTQTVAFRFEGEQTGTTSTPTGVDLIASSDSGVSSTDNITNAGSLTFTVSGVTSGATVELVRTGTGVVIGTGIASGTTINITTSNIAALGDGTYNIAARQRVGSTTSSLSPALVLVYDRTSPASVISSASTQANVGRAYVSDLISPEEGNGLRYALTAMPTGATINATTGVITWTPTSTQTGANTFSIELTDVAGNVRAESFTVSTGGSPLAEIKLRITDLQGNEISNVNVGDTFLLEMIGVDARGGFDRRGLFAAAADILFNSALIQPVAGSNIEYGPGFTTQRGGVFSTGLIDELGAARTETTPTGLRESLVAKVRMTALAAGSLNIRSEPAENVNSEVLLYLVDNQIAADDVAYGSVSLAIGQNFTVRPDTATVAEDSAATTINVLANDVVNSGGGTLSVTAVSQPTSGGTVTLTGGQVRFTPTANFNGTAQFTYTASISGGGSQTGSVTVTVTPVNDPPTGVADTFTVDQDSAATELDVLANDSIAPDSGETLRITRVVNSSAGSTISVNTAGNRVSYRPPAGFTGTDTFTYTLSDGALTTDVQVTVTVRSVDPPPTAVADSFTVVEDATQAAFDVTANDTRDAANQSFVISAAGVPSQGGAASVNADGTRLLYQPRANFNGTETVTYTIRDTGGGTAVGTVTFTVTSVNDPPPTLSPTRNVNRTAGETVVLSTSNLPANVDANETLTFTVLGTRSSGGAARISTDGTQIFYTPPSTTFTGTDTFTFTVRDSNNLTSSGTITVQVNDFSLAQVNFDFGNSAFVVDPTVFNLVGTDVLGGAVSMSLSVSSSGAFFRDVLPGNYSVAVPAFAFLQNATTPRSLALNIAADNTQTNLSLTPNLGSLRAQFVSMSDWFGSAPKKSILAAVAPGQSQTFASLSTGTDTITSPSLRLDAAGSNLTITGKNATGANVTATVPTANDRRVELRGQAGEMRLVRVSVETADVTFNPVTTGTASSGAGSNAAVSSTPSSSASSSTSLLAGAEGELIAASSALATPLAVTSVANASTTSLVLGDQMAANDSLGASAVSRADVFVPPVAAVSTPVRRALASRAMSDSGVGVDAAMSDLLPSLELRSATGDAVAEAQNSGASLDESSVDEVLRSEI